jgi:hypothetical protein
MVYYYFLYWRCSHIFIICTESEKPKSEPFLLERLTYAKSHGFGIVAGMRIRSMKVVFLRAAMRQLNADGFRNSQIAAASGVSLDAVIRLISHGLRPAPEECDRLENFARQHLKALQPKPPKPLAERIRNHRRRLVRFAGDNRVRRAA